jgi:hypothetical protein
MKVIEYLLRRGVNTPKRLQVIWSAKKGA